VHPEKFLRIGPVPHGKRRFENILRHAQSCRQSTYSTYSTLFGRGSSDALYV